MTAGQCLYVAFGLVIGIFVIKTCPDRKDIISPILASAMLGGFIVFWPILVGVAVIMGMGRWLANPNLR